MYAIIEACGRQYKVEEKEIIFFEKLNVEEGKKVTFDKVILVSDNGKVQVGNPYVKNVKVEGKVISHGKAKKILVFKYKPKKNERVTRGHRQQYTKVEITSIKTGSNKTEKPKKEEKVEPKQDKKVTKKEKSENKTEKKENKK